MQTGQEIAGRYSLVSQIGRGGMAEVWCATDTRLQRDVAVKFLDPRLASDPEFLVRFFSEAQGVARISHPGVVRVLDFGQAEDRPYLVMEYVDGGALSELVGEPLLVERAFEIVAQAARGAGAAHSSGIVHRDIKPANILLDGSGHAKLADFGIAANRESERFTATGAAIGSPHYISPEQISGSPATPASDVYSLGVVLYELLTGERPFDGDNVTAIAIAHVDKEPTPPSELNPDLDATVDALVLRCLAKDPAERFEDGNDLAAALEPARSHAPVAAATGVVATIDDDDDEIEPASGFPRPRSALATAVVIVLLALAAVGVVTAAGDGGAPPTDQAQASDDDTEDKKRRRPSPSPSSVEAAVTQQPSPSASPDGDEKEKDEPSTDTEEPAEEPKDEEPTETEPEPTPTPAEEPSPEPSPDAGSSDPQNTSGDSGSDSSEMSSGSGSDSTP